PSDGKRRYVDASFTRGVSAGGQPVSFTSTAPRSNACSAVAPSVMIFSCTCPRCTRPAAYQPGLRVRVSDASCFQAVSVNGPSLTMCPGSVHAAPHFVTASRFTGMNDVCESCCMNHGCGDVSTTSTVVAFGAVIATFERSAAQSPFAEVGRHRLYACAPTIP